MKTNKFFAGFFMLLAMLMIAMAGGEPVTGGGDPAHLWQALGMAVICALSLYIVGRLSRKNKNYSRKGTKWTR